MSILRVLDRSLITDFISILCHPVYATPKSAADQCTLYETVCLAELFQGKSFRSFKYKDNDMPGQSYPDLPCVLSVHVSGGEQVISSVIISWNLSTNVVTMTVNVRLRMLVSLSCF